MKIGMLLHPSIHLNANVCGGIERRVLATLSTLNGRGHCTNVWVSGVTGQHEHVRTVRDSNWRNVILRWPYYLRFLRETLDCDILHGHYAPSLALLAPRRSVIHLAGLSVAEIPLYRYFADRSHCAEFVSNSHHIADKFRSMYPDIPDDHLHVIHNGADTALFVPGVRRRHEAAVNLTFSSLWEEPKGMFELLEAVELLEKRRKDFRLHLVGSALFEGTGERQRADQERVERWSARLSTVEIVGELGHPHLADHLKRMDVGVFPSNHEEPFGNAVVEMMAAGLPVVAFDIGGPREIVVDGQTGFLVENRNVPALATALETLIDNEQLRLEMGAKARKRVEQYFTWDRHVDQLLEIYEQIIRRNHDRKH